MKSWLLCRVWQQKSFKWTVLVSPTGSHIVLRRKWFRNAWKLHLAPSQPLCHGTYPRSSEPRCSRSWTFELVAVASGAVVVAGVRCSEKLWNRKNPFTIASLGWTLLNLPQFPLPDATRGLARLTRRGHLVFICNSHPMVYTERLLRSFPGRIEQNIDKPRSLLVR